MSAFPIDPIYLDHAATAPPRREVLEAMWPHLTGGFANPASRYAPGLDAENALEDARLRVARQLGARPAEIIFTSGGTEADNAAVKGIVLARMLRGRPARRHVLVSAVEHSAVLESARWLEALGAEAEVIPVDGDGLVSPETLRSMLRPETALVSVQTANNEVGTIQDVPALAEVTTDQGAYFHTDAVQAASAVRLDVRELGIDALSLSGHKLGTPKGVGVLYLRRRTPFEPLVHGGGQQRDLRSGTEDVAGAVGMATALESTATERDDGGALRSRREAFVEAVQESAAGARLTGHPQRRLPGHASFVLPGRSGESMLLDLERRGVLCSSGSACSAASAEPSHVLTAMGFSRDESLSALRFTFGPHTPSEELDRAVAALH